MSDAVTKRIIDQGPKGWEQLKEATTVNPVIIDSLRALRYESPHKVTEGNLSTNGNVTCSCGGVFSSKGYRIHSGMLNGRAFKAFLKEAEKLEDEIGWSRGTLSSPDGWPTPPAPPPTRKQLEQQRREQARQIRKIKEANKAAEEAEALLVAKALLPVLRLPLEASDKYLTSLGRRIEALLEEAGLYIRGHYDEW